RAAAFADDFAEELLADRVAFFREVEPEVEEVIELDAAVAPERRREIVAAREERAQLLQGVVAGACRRSRVLRLARELEGRETITVVVSGFVGTTEEAHDGDGLLDVALLELLGERAKRV